MAGLTKDAELHQMKESEKELLGPHAKPLSELEKVTVDKIHKDDNREYVREVLATPLGVKRHELQIYTTWMDLKMHYVQKESLAHAQNCTLYESIHLRF